MIVVASIGTSGLERIPHAVVETEVFTIYPRLSEYIDQSRKATSSRGIQLDKSIIKYFAYRLKEGYCVQPPKVPP